jgi:hypothetical protein
MTVEKRIASGVFLPFVAKIFARVYFGAGSSPIFPSASNSP